MSQTLADRLWAKVKRRGPHDCWEWTRSLDEGGYARIWLTPGKSPITIHRAVWLVTHGEVPDGKVVLTCPLLTDCCNPDHIGLGSGKDVGDRILWRKRQERRPPRTKRVPKLSDQSVREIRAAPSSTTHEELARRYGVTATYIRLIRERERRKDVT